MNVDRRSYWSCPIDSPSARRVYAPWQYTDPPNRFVNEHLTQPRRHQSLMHVYSCREPPGLLRLGSLHLQDQPVRTYKRSQASGQGLCCMSNSQIHRIILTSNVAIQPIAKNALTMLINLSEDKQILQNLATDDTFLESLMLRITVCQWPKSSFRVVARLVTRSGNPCGSQAVLMGRPEPERAQRE